MKVHITATPEISKNEINEITAVLSTVKGEITFMAGTPLTIDQMELKFSGFDGSNLVEPLSFDDFFYLCKYYAVNHTPPLPKDDFVVVLSSIQNNRDYYSAFKKNYIFVRTTDWEYITKKDSKYGIAYQIVENIFESLIGIDINNVNIDPNVHHISIGCMTDMCHYEHEAILKLRTAYICDSCLERAKNNNLNTRILLQIQLIIDYIRVELMNFNLIKEQLVPDKVSVNENGTVKIGEKELVFEDVPLTLFIFFLRHLEGIKPRSLKNHYTELKNIYKVLRPNEFLEPIKNLCGTGLSEKSTFQKVKSELNKALINEVGKQMSEFYVLYNDNTIYKVRLNPDYLNIDLRF